jgi:hypothetical protein
MSQDGPFSRAQTLANQKCERKNVYELSLDQTRLRFGGHALLWDISSSRGQLFKGGLALTLG